MAYKRKWLTHLWIIPWKMSTLQLSTFTIFRNLWQYPSSILFASLAIATENVRVFVSHVCERILKITELTFPYKAYIIIYCFHRFGQLYQDYHDNKLSSFFFWIYLFENCFQYAWIILVFFTWPRVYFLTNIDQQIRWPMDIKAYVKFMNAVTSLCNATSKQISFLAFCSANQF